MANEIKRTLLVDYSNVDLKRSIDPGSLNIDQANQLIAEKVHTLSTGGSFAAMFLGDITSTQVGYTYLRNLSTGSGKAFISSSTITTTGTSTVHADFGELKAREDDWIRVRIGKFLRFGTDEANLKLHQVTYAD